MNNFTIVFNAYFNTKQKLGHSNAVWYKNSSFESELFYEKQDCDTYFENWIKGLAFGITTLIPKLSKDETQINFVIGTTNYSSNIANVVKFLDSSIEIAQSLVFVDPNLLTDEMIGKLIKKKLYYKDVSYMDIRVLIVRQLLDIKSHCTTLEYSTDVRATPYPPVNAAIVLMHEHINPNKKKQYKMG